MTAWPRSKTIKKIESGPTKVPSKLTRMSSKISRKPYHNKQYIEVQQNFHWSTNIYLIAVPDVQQNKILIMKTGKSQMLV